MIRNAHVDFVSIPVRDLHRARDFYEHTLDLPLSPHSGDRWVEFDLENVTIALVSPEAMGPQFLESFQPSSVPIAFRVDDVEAAQRELEAKGVAFATGMIDSGVCHIAPFHDPDGNLLQLHRRYAPYADGTSSQPRG